jgi:hypothetical protein
LSDVIIARGLVKPAAMKAALQASLAGRSLTEILVDNGELSEDDLARTLAEHHRLDHVDLEIFAVDRVAAALVEPDVARRFGAVPIAMLPAGILVVALYDPNGSTAVLEFAQLTGRVIQPAVASRTQVATVIDALRREQQAPGIAPPAHPGGADPRMPDTRLHSVPAGDIVIPRGGGPADHLRPPSPAWSPSAPATASAAAPPHDEDPVDGFESHLQAVRQRAEAAERRRHEAEERARAADELTRIADARASAAEERALAAERLVAAAEERVDGMSSAAEAANETLTRLVRACELLEGEAQKRAPEMEALRTRIHELERQLAERDGAPAPARVAAPPAPVAAPPAPAAASPAPVAPPAAAVAAPRARHAAPPAPVAAPRAPDAAPPAPVAAPPAAVAAPRAQVVAPAVNGDAPTPPVPASPARASARPPAPARAPQPPPEASEPPAMTSPARARVDVPSPQPVADPDPEPEAIAPSLSPTIDIPGDPGVPFVRALAPMSSPETAKAPKAAKTPKAAKGAATNARGLRRIMNTIRKTA